MTSWNGDHGIFGKADAEMCHIALAEEKTFPGPYDVPVGGMPIKIGNGFISIEQGEFQLHEEYIPCIRVKLFYIDENDDEQIAAEVFAPFRDPDTKEERGWAVVVREAYMELVEAVEGRLY